MPAYTVLENGILVPAAFAEGRPPAAPVRREVATISGGRDITRGYVDGLDLLRPQDSVLATRGGYDHKAYEEVLRDEQVGATLQQRQLALISREWDVDPGGKKRQDKAAAEFIREVLDHIAWDAVTRKMLFGVFYGYAVSECLWARDGRFVMLDVIKVKKPRRFGFHPDGSLRLRTSTNPRGEVLPERKFWTFCTGADNDDEPYGLGLGHWLYWPVLFKRAGVKFWMMFLEKFGMPTAKGTYPANATATEITKLLQALGAIQTDSGVAVPEGMAIELLEAARSGSADYGAMCDRMDRSIAKVVLGQVMTSEAVGGQYKAEVQNDVRLELVKADADLINQSFSRQVVRWLVDWNFPGAAYPTVWRNVEEPDDLNARADRDTKLHAMGFAPTLEYIHDTYGEGYEMRPPTPPDNPQVSEAPAGAAPPAGLGADDPALAEGEPDAADQAAERLALESAPALDSIIERIRREVDLAESMADLQDRLVAIYSHLDIDQLGEVMRMAFAAAHLAGRDDVSAGR